MQLLQAPDGSGARRDDHSHLAQLCPMRTGRKWLSTASGSDGPELRRDRVCPEHGQIKWD